MATFNIGRGFLSHAGRVARALVQRYNVRVELSQRRSYTDGTSIYIDLHTGSFVGDAKTMFDGILDHEISHLLHSDFPKQNYPRKEELRAAIRRKKLLCVPATRKLFGFNGTKLFDIYQHFEDIRVNRAMRKFPGALENIVSSELLAFYMHKQRINREGILSYTLLDRVLIALRLRNVADRKFLHEYKRLYKEIFSKDELVLRFIKYYKKSNFQRKLDALSSTEDTINRTEEFYQLFSKYINQQKTNQQQGGSDAKEPKESKQPQEPESDSEGSKETSEADDEDCDSEGEAEESEDGEQAEGSGDESEADGEDEDEAGEEDDASGGKDAEEAGEDGQSPEREAGQEDGEEQEETHPKAGTSDEEEQSAEDEAGSSEEDWRQVDDQKQRQLTESQEEELDKQRPEKLQDSFGEQNFWKEQESLLEQKRRSGFDRDEYYEPCMAEVVEADRVISISEAIKHGVEVEAIPSMPLKKEELRVLYKKNLESLGNEVSQVTKAFLQKFFSKTLSFQYNTDEPGNPLDLTEVTKQFNFDDYNAHHPFIKTMEGDKKSIAVTVLIDCSGSMQSEGKLRKAQSIAIALAETFKRLNVSSEFLGHDANANFKVAGKRLRNSSDTGRQQPYRLFVVKDFNEPTFENIALFENISGSCNSDGAALQEAGSRLLLRNEDRKMFFYICDGRPTGYHAESAGIKHMQDMVKQFTMNNIEFYAIGLEVNVTEIFGKKIAFELDVDGSLEKNLVKIITNKI